MKKCQNESKQKNEGQLEAFTFAKNDSNKNTQLVRTNKDVSDYVQSLKNNISNELQYEGQRTNELANFSNKGTLKADNNEQIENDNFIQEDNNMNENDMMGSYSYEQQDNDFYYFISENIPPQNFTKKLRNIKLKYAKLEKEIEKLKKENKKYNPNFIIRNYKNLNDDYI